MRTARSSNVFPILFLSAFVLVAIGALFVLQARGQITPLLTGDAQFSRDAFLTYTPDYKMTFMPKAVLDEVSVKENIRRMPDGTFPASAGRLETAPFMPTRYLGVPVKGSDTNQRNLYRQKSIVEIECIRTGDTIDLLKGQSEEWFMSTVRIRDGWCDGPVKVIAVSKADTLHVGIGTPLKISALQYFMSGTVGVVVAAMLAFVLCVLVSVPFIALPNFGWGSRLTLAAGYPSVFGYMAFMLVWYSGANPFVLQLTAWVFLGTPAALYWATQRRHPVADCHEEDVRRFVLGLLVLCTVLVLPYVVIGTGGGYWFSAYAFFPASWTTDNILSMQEVRSIIYVGAIHPYPLATWSISDRGIVQPGTLFALFGLPWLRQPMLEWPVGIYAQALFASVLQGLAVPAGMVFLSKYMKSNVRSILVGVMLVCTPFIMFNSAYAWPKLSAGLLALIAILWFHFSVQTGNPRSMCVALLIFVFGVLNHSASLLTICVPMCYLVFGLLAGDLKLDLVLKAFSGAPIRLGLTVVLSVCLLQWVEAIEPKSSFPLTYLLTGDGRFGMSKAQIWQAVIAHFRAFTVESFLREKILDLRDLIWTTRSVIARDNGSQWSLPAIRAREFFSLLPAMGPGMLLAFVMSMVGRRTRPNQAGSADESIDRGLLLMGLSCIVSLLLVVLLCGMEAIVLQLPYGIILCLLTVMLLSCRGNKLALSLGVLAQVLNLAFVWYFGAAQLWNAFASGSFYS
ncbi:hypothetical protein [Paraburkholderia phosphatilytica]|uniref:hypothetical protein n=1 Tax=Paraburkholderia phosphatilytica TaxID=2282883 RepID=UPI000F5E633E|nr:hypothetical protein [Paraburkholderia phosphatilytica]